jgi:hypothetical protein
VHAVCIEPSAAGHRMVYAGRMIDALAEEDFKRCTVWTSEAWRAHERVKALKEHNKISIDIRFIPAESVERLRPKSSSPVQLVVASLQRLHLYQRLLAMTPGPIQLAFSAFADDLWPAIAIWPNALGRFSGVFMRTAFHREAMGIQAPRRRLEAINGMLMRRLLWKSRLPHWTFDKYLWRYVSEKWPELENKLQFLPDPVSPPRVTKSQARESLGLPSDVKILAVMAPDPRKGLELLQQALAHPHWPKRWRVLLAGTGAAECSEMIRFQVRNIINIYVKDGFLSDEDFLSAIVASDLIWCVYPNFFSVSGVLIHAARLSSAVLVSKQGTMAKHVTDWKCGIHVSSVEEIVDTLRHFDKYPEDILQLGKNGKQASHEYSVSGFLSPIRTVGRLAASIAIR